MRYKYGMVHGRFQPFHLEHLRYFRLAWERSENVLVGITNPDPSSIK
ncbi:MAG: nicotinate-nucleotide adenylyltransferase, partial [Desulfobulbia bacterium]